MIQFLEVASLKEVGEANVDLDQKLNCYIEK